MKNSQLLALGFLLVTGLGYGQQQTVRVIKKRNTKELDISYQSTYLAKHIPLTYTHFFGRHGLVAGLRWMRIKSRDGLYNYDSKDKLGITLGYQFKLDKDKQSRWKPYLSYQFLYTPTTQIFAPQYQIRYAAVENLLYVGIKPTLTKRWYANAGVGYGLTTYIGIGGGGLLEGKNLNRTGFTAKIGIGYRISE